MVGDEAQTGGPEGGVLARGAGPHHLVDDTPVDPVHPVVVLGDDPRLLDITLHDRLEHLVELDAAELGHPLEVVQAARGGVAGELAGELGDAHAVVPHPLQLGGHVEVREHHAQVAVHRCLSEEGDSHQLAQLELEGVDLGVAGDHLVAERGVVLDEPRHRPADRPSDEHAHARRLLPDLRELAVEDLTERMLDRVAHRGTRAEAMAPSHGLRRARVRADTDLVCCATSPDRGGSARLTTWSGLATLWCARRV